MMKVFYFYKVTALDLDERNTEKYFGIVAADSYADAAGIIEENFRDDLVSIDYLEATDQNLFFTTNKELYDNMYQELN